MDRRWLQYVGDCGAPAAFLSGKSASSAWLPILAVDALLRSFGQIILANNPVTGLVYFVGVTLVRPWAGLGALLCGVVSLITAGLSKQPRPAIAAGQAMTNTAMLGFVTMAILHESPSMRACLLLTGASVVTCYVTSALSSLVNALQLPRSVVAHNNRATHQWPPLFALPFGLLQLLILVLLPEYKLSYELGNSTFNASLRDTAAFNSSTHLLNATESFNASELHINWGSFLEEIVSAPALVLTVHSIIAGATGWAAILVYSPTAAGCALLGALEAAVVGIALDIHTNNPAEVVTSYGEAAANGLLTFMAVSSHSFVPSCGATAAGVAATALVGALHATARSPLLRAGLPLLLLPYSIVSILFYLVAHLARPSAISFPEKQRFDHIGRFGCGSGNDDDDDDDDDEDEEKPPQPIPVPTRTLSSL